MKCENGHLIEDGDSFCTSCGAPSQPEVLSAQRKRLIPIAATIAVGLISALTFFGLRQIRTNESAKSDSVTSEVPTSLSSTSTAAPSTTTTAVRESNSQGDLASAWQRAASTISSSAKVSPITNIAGTPTVVVGDTQALNSANPPYLTIWEYRNGAWATAIRQPLGLPTANIEFMDLTEDSALDVVVNAVAASEFVSFVYSRTGATWGLVRWGTAKSETPAGQLFLDSNQQLYVSTRNCTPSCAEGGRINTYWVYDKASGTFVRK